MTVASSRVFTPNAISPQVLSISTAQLCLRAVRAAATGAALTIYVLKHMIHLHVAATHHLSPSSTGTSSSSSSPQRGPFTLRRLLLLLPSGRHCILGRRSQRPIWRDAVTSCHFEAEKLCIIHGCYTHRLLTTTITGSAFVPSPPEQQANNCYQPTLRAEPTNHHHHHNRHISA